MIPHSRPSVGAEEAEAARRVVLSGRLAQGREVAAFEEEMAAFAGRRCAVAVSSGTAALHLALLALEVGEGDEVLIPSYVCAALLHAVRATGARPVAGDIEARTRNLDAAQARRLCRASTRALIVPHMFGLPAALESFEALGVPLVEDCAMALGAARGGRRLGSFGRASVCSFYATKLLCSGGEGGMVLTDAPEVAAKVRALREYDALPAALLRFNCKMTEVAAAIGRVQLRRLPEFIARRRRLAAQYQAAFAELNLELPPQVPEHIYYRYVIHARGRAGAWIAGLERRGVAARRPVYHPLHRELGGGDQTCPRAAAAFEGDVSLPIYPSLSAAEVEQLLGAVRRVAGEKRGAG